MIAHDILKLQNGSDIRGIAVSGVEGEFVNLTEEICNWIGQSFVQWLAKKINKPAHTLVVGIGRDSRISGERLAASVASGMSTQGASVIDCALATTPAMFMSTVFPQTRYDGAVMITASHLPFNRNGIKFFDKDGGLEKSDIMTILESVCAMHDVESGCHDARNGDAANSGNRAAGGAVVFSNGAAAQPYASSCDLLSLYAEHLRSTICRELGAAESDKPLAGLKVVIDAGNGTSGYFVSKLLVPLGADTTGSQFLEPDGMFPNHIPNPENKDAMESVRTATLHNRADIGLIFDTDGDRMSAVLSDGTEVSRDAVIALFAAILAPRYPGSTIVTDSVTSDRLTFFLQEVLGLHHMRYMRGYKNVINKCKELNAKGIVSPLAMETSGHGALKDNYYLDDGAFLAVQLLIAMSRAKAAHGRVDSLIAKLPPLVEEVEHRLKITTDDFMSYGNSVLAAFKMRAQKAGCELAESYEGVRISFRSDDIRGWLLLRLSLHDPVMPLNAEGERIGDCAKIIAVAKELLVGFDKLDTACLQ
ncbi:MAG: phosphomannomutase/phosphoglucomutase [Treponema sp.]|nr:phosphomannomutase/phosphoglucomutase [Treponema sp.]